MLKELPVPKGKKDALKKLKKDVEKELMKLPLDLLEKFLGYGMTVTVCNELTDHALVKKYKGKKVPKGWTLDPNKKYDDQAAATLDGKHVVITLKGGAKAADATLHEAGHVADQALGKKGKKLSESEDWDKAREADRLNNMEGKKGLRFGSKWDGESVENPGFWPGECFAEAFGYTFGGGTDRAEVKDWENMRKTVKDLIDQGMTGK